MFKITLTLPENIYHHATHLAAVTHLDVASIITEALAITLPAFDEAMTALAPTAPPDGEKVRVVTDSQTASAAIALLKNDERWRGLLSQRHAGEMSTEEITSLLSLLLMQRCGWLLQSEVGASVAERDAFND